MKEFCDSFIRLDDIPLASPWFDTSGGRLQSDIKYSLSEKAKPVVELLREIAQVKAESKKDFVELARKSLQRIDAITHQATKAGAAAGRNPEATATPAGEPNATATAGLPYVVKFEQGAARFLKGDEITIVEVRGTADTIMPGNIYWIKGTYTLASHDRAMLAAFTTARDAADGTGPSLKVQTTVVTRGTGTFTLFRPVSCRGSPHVSFYAADGGEDFGGSYFGTGDSVLKQWWGAKGGSAQENGLPAAKEKPTANRPASTPAAGNDVSKQLLAEFRRAYALPDDKVVKRVAPPVSPARMEYYRVHDAEQAKAILC